MHSLEGITAMNAAAVRKAKRGAAETETSRHCSFSGDRDAGVVLHSAKQRSTVFVSKGPAAACFLMQWHATNSAEVRDRIVETYFRA